MFHLTSIIFSYSSTSKDTENQYLVLKSSLWKRKSTLRFGSLQTLDARKVKSYKNAFSSDRWCDFRSLLNIIGDNNYRNKSIHFISTNALLDPTTNLE